MIVEAGRSDQYRVRVGNVTTWCRGEDLEGAAESPRSKRGARARREEPSASANRVAATTPRLDLHGLRVEDAMARVIEAIDRALVDGADRLEVVHGKGSGRIRDELHRRLASMRVVVSFGLDPDNPGVTWVHF